MRKLRNGEAAIIESDRGLGARTAEARRPCVEKSFNGVGGVIVGDQLVAGVQKLRESDEPRNARGFSQELVAPGARKRKAPWRVSSLTPRRKSRSSS